MDLHDRLNWQQACEVLGCSKSALYRLVDEEHLKAHGVGKRCRWYSRAECLAYLEKNTCQGQEETLLKKGSLASASTKARPSTVR